MEMSAGLIRCESEIGQVFKKGLRLPAGERAVVRESSSPPISVIDGFLCTDSRRRIGRISTHGNWRHFGASRHCSYGSTPGRLGVEQELGNLTEICREEEKSHYH